MGKASDLQSVRHSLVLELGFTPVFTDTHKKADHDEVFPTVDTAPTAAKPSDVCQIQVIVPFLLPFLLPFVALNVIGMVLIGIGRLRAGCIAYMIGSVAFVPIGLIGVFGARAMLDKQRRQAFLGSVAIREDSLLPSRGRAAVWGHGTTLHRSLGPERAVGCHLGRFPAA